MTLPSTFFLIFFSTTLVFGPLHPAFHRTLGPWPTTPEEERKALTKHRQQRSIGSPQDNPECQEGSQLGASYSGKVNVTQSQKRQKLSGQQDFCRKNFPDKARKLRQFSNSQQMTVKGVLARS